MSYIDLGNITTEISSPFDLSKLLAGVGGLVSTGYNIYANKRDYDYQKALQQQIFERDDTAVQRRVEDLKAAGLNPVLAAGSGANAGSIVARSNTNDINIGAALDYLQALQSLRNMKAQNRVLNSEARKTYYEANVYEHTGEAAAQKAIYENDWYKYLNGLTDGMSQKLIDYFDYQYKNMKNSSDILQKQNDWFNTNEFLNIGGKFINAASGIYRFR